MDPRVKPGGDKNKPGGDTVEPGGEREMTVPLATAPLGEVGKLRGF
jgi:hypothetical protein